MLKVTCSGCGTAFYVGQDAAGQETRCGACGLILRVPVETGPGGASAQAVEGAWEYFVLSDRGRLGHVDQDKLNELGMQAWELVTIFREGPEAHVVYYFKRPRKTVKS